MSPFGDTAFPEFKWFHTNWEVDIEESLAGQDRKEPDRVTTRWTVREG
jgi:hypothetical protein